MTDERRSDDAKGRNDVARHVHLQRIAPGAAPEESFDY